MRIIRTFAVLPLVAVLAACAGQDPVTRGVPLDAAASEQATQRNYNVVAVSVDVPTTLTVSEAHSYYPNADIVWRGDAPGDRHDQVRAMVESSAAMASDGLHGTRDVQVAIKVSRFHALTEKARYSVGGVHAVKLVMGVYDAQTGEAIEEPRVIDASLKGYGGLRAIEAEREGQTQKVRLTNHMAGVIQRELRPPSDTAPSQS